MEDFRNLVNLASERLGAAVLAANDDFFAPKESLVRDSAPVFKEGEYTDRGKWMDGWETRRRREPGYDWAILRLGLSGIVRGVVVDTAHFKGNYPESCSIEACEGPPDAGAGALEAAAWTEILPRTPLAGDRENAFPVTSTGRSTHLRLNIFPDGGVARLKAYGLVLPDWARLARESAVDLAAIENGGLVVAASDMFFGSRHNLILPGRGRGMHDGWETKRRRGPGHDWAIVKLGRPGAIRAAEVDTIHFKGNAPGSCSIDVATVSGAQEKDAAASDAAWRPLLPQTPLKPHTLHRFEGEIRDAGEATHARLNIYPDGGVSRLRLYARP
ncbi:MAG TPA: allantoicase [Thermoanaerobaculia bacterium]|nr:allantoicase [Thermoanaerobaculia bacterium]